MKAKISGFLLLGLLFVCPNAYSWRSFAPFKLGAEAVGIGGAYVAEASSETAMAYNPAGLLQLEDRIYFMYEIYSSARIPDVLNWDVSFKFDYFPFLGVVGGGESFKIGVSIFTLFHSLEKGNDFNVRNMALSFACNLLPNLSVGAGVGPVFALEGNGIGFSYAYNIGILWKAANSLQVGFCFHSPIELNWSRTDQGVSLWERYPLSAELGLSYLIVEKLFGFFSLEFIDWNSVSYILDGKDYSPRVDENLFARFHPHIGVRFLEENTGAHISLGFMIDSFYYESGSVNQYFLTAGVRFYGKNMIFRAALSDSLLIGFFYPGNTREERLNVSLSFKL
jgi:hypothetical protein